MQYSVNATIYHTMYTFKPPKTKFLSMSDFLPSRYSNVCHELDVLPTEHQKNLFEFIFAIYILS